MRISEDVKKRVEKGVKKGVKKGTVLLASACCTLSVTVMPAISLAPPALADPPGPAPGPAPTDPTPPTPPAASAAAAPAAAGVPHLSSPQNLPPGTTDVPPQGRRLGYLRDLWHAVQTQEVSGSDALLLLTQRPMDPNAVPPPGLPADPQPPAAGPAPGS